MYLAEDYTDYNEFEYFDLRAPADIDQALLLLDVTRCADSLQPHMSVLSSVRTYFDLRRLDKEVLALLMDFETSRLALLSADNEMPVDRALMDVYEDAASDVPCTFKGTMLFIGETFIEPPICTLFEYF